MDTRTRFEAPWNGQLRVITALVTVLLLGSAAMLGQAPMSVGFRWFVFVLLGVTLVSAPMFQVLGYEVRGGELAVLRPGWSTRFPLRGLESVERLARGGMAGVRLWGNGGFWSFTGWYWNSRLGRFRCFLNDSSRGVVLRYADRRLVVAPDDPEAFMAAVRRAAALA